jgi:hypothetical protein
MNLDNILWITRGNQWGFRILLKPQLECEDWFDIYELIFDQNSTEKEQFLKSDIQINNNVIPFVSVVFLDPTSRKDQSTRIIPHKIAILGNDCKFFDDLDSVKQSLWPKLSDVYSELYDYSVNQMSKVELIINNSSLIIQEKQKELETFEEQEKNFWKAIPMKAVVVIALPLLLLLLIYLNNAYQEKELKPQKKSESKISEDLNLPQVLTEEEQKIPPEGNKKKIQNEWNLPESLSKSSVLSREDSNLSLDFPNKSLQPEE